ncbi:hypothetical protein GCM10010330_27220 [Streptomyces tendae]|nr:hypothetical protein GCM10010330_27220 [Streptomyces tendae]
MRSAARVLAALNPADMGITLRCARIFPAGEGELPVAVARFEADQVLEDQLRIDRPAYAAGTVGR